MAGNRSLMNHCRNESKGIEQYIGTSYDHLVRVSENLDKIRFIAKNIDSILDGVIVNTTEVVGNIQKEGENMLSSIQKDLERYIKMFEKDMDVLVSDKIQFIDETLTGIERDSEFAIRQKDFEGRIDKVEQVIASEREASANQRNELHALYNDNKSTITEFKEVIAKEKETSSKFYTKVDQELHNGRLRLEEIKDTVLSLDQARITTENFIVASLDENTSKINDLQKIIVTNTEALSETINDISATVGDNTASIEELRRTTAEADKVTASHIEKLTAELLEVKNSQGDSVNLSSEILLERLTETTNTQTATTINSLQNSVMGANTANISLQQMTLANESEVRANQTTYLTAGYNDNFANILLNQTVVANEISTRASEHRKLTAHYLDNVAEIEGFKTVYAQDKEVLAETLDTLKAEVNTVIKGDIEELRQTFNSEFIDFRKTYATDKKATAESLETLKSEINTTIKGDIDSLRNQVSSEITSVRKTVSDLSKSTAESSLNLKSEMIATIDKSAKDTQNLLKKDTDTKISNSEKKLNTSIEGLRNKISESEKTFNDTIGVSINDLEKQIFDTSKNLTKEIENANPGIVDTRNDNQPPSWYYANYPKKTITEFKRAQVMGLGTSPTYCTVTTTVQWSDPSGGGITQNADWGGKKYIRNGGTSTKNDTWSHWLLLEDATSAQNKAITASKNAIEESKKYTDTETGKVQSKVSAEIIQVNKTLSDLNGNVAAMTSLTAVTTVGGTKIISGLSFGSNGKQASFKIYADKFAIVSSDGRIEVPAFTTITEGGTTRVGINGNLFVAGSINGNAIKAGSRIEAPLIYGGSLSLGDGRFVVTKAGDVSISADPKKYVGLRITSENITVYDENGRVRVKLGKL